MWLFSCAVGPQYIFGIRDLCLAHACAPMQCCTPYFVLVVYLCNQEIVSLHVHMHVFRFVHACQSVPSLCMYMFKNNMTTFKNE